MFDNVLKILDKSLDEILLLPCNGPVVFPSDVQNSYFFNGRKMLFYENVELMRDDKVARFDFGKSGCETYKKSLLNTFSSSDESLFSDDSILYLK